MLVIIVLFHDWKFVWQRWWLCAGEGDDPAAIYHPKNKSIALFTIPELLIGVIEVPVISFALCAVFRLTCASGRARLIDKLLTNNIKKNMPIKSTIRCVSTPKSHFGSLSLRTYSVRDSLCLRCLDLCSRWRRSLDYLLEYVRGNSVPFHIPNSMRIASEPNCRFAADTPFPIWCRTVQNGPKSSTMRLAKTHRQWSNASLADCSWQAVSNNLLTLTYFDSHRIDQAVTWFCWHKIKDIKVNPIAFVP